MKNRKYMSAKQLAIYSELLKTKTLTNDDRVYAVYKVLKINSKSYEDCIKYLQYMNRLLSCGVKLDTIINFMRRNSYEGAEEIPMKNCELALSDIENVVIALPKFDGKQIKDVIFNDPATIVLWKDGTKTVVKCQKDKGDTYNTELGLAMCIIKKMCDNKGNYNDVFNKWLPKED